MCDTYFYRTFNQINHGCICLNINFIKRRYFESRIGSVTINPILAASNFIMLIWITLSTDVIPFWVFVPLALTGMISLVTIVGYKFRTIQLSTDEDMKYEKQKELNKTLYMIMNELYDPLKSTPAFEKRMQEVKKIADT
jgi:hypothetical protein